MKNLTQDFGKVAVLLGGGATEREVSLVGGKAILQSLQKQKVDVTAIDVGEEDVVSKFSNGDFDRVFIVLHGRGGEDGVIQGFLETLKIPYTGSSVAASALSMDKVRSKLIWERLQLPTLPFITLELLVTDEIKSKFSLPICIKPIHEGSSNGVNRVDDWLQLEEAYADALRYHDQVMVEPWIEGREFTVGILNNQVLPVVEICVSEGFYSYEAKYGDIDTHYYCPCDLPLAQQEELQHLALQAHNSLGCSGWGRIDFLQDRQGKFWLTEANTVPGMTERSLVPKAAQAAGIDFDELVLKILMTSFSSNER